ncbi:MAG: methylaspartate mutase subunit S [Rhodospirillales bacterium]|jgi:methylaspartate mutase sigma subunit|nr:methylaspartate mutase subunit S [Rhodospirillaceae bacterium]MDP6427105.1 methylaspartate mutase subunit S [Rhodospirillales bacterium]MDP6645730.1 methylaspartate mutase subunit S [Rhodospirillales bacterium]MDP6842412.1 methylaspartate mutase subunit S [Rhodospirillales bacterium]|tara:strand:- start:235 stop:660 length:426 start_codon:yes stop_codon:yes gene_type:complete
MPSKNIVIGTIGADAHMIGAWVLQKALTTAGFNVTFLGAVVPQEEFISAAIETDADAILVSSMYGMGILDCEGLRDKCIESGLEDILLYAGGTVAAPLELEKNWPQIEERFSKMGFNRVYPNTVTVEEVIAALKSDLGLKD